MNSHRAGFRIGEIVVIRGGYLGEYPYLQGQEAQIVSELIAGPARHHCQHQFGHHIASPLLPASREFHVWADIRVLHRRPDPPDWLRILRSRELEHV